jgi:hypothetical protein
MKNVLFGLTALALLAGCDAENESGPNPLAKHFMSEFYGVEPDDVTVFVMADGDETPRTVMARAGEHACRMQMAPAPAGVSASFGWLVSSMQCDQSECKQGEVRTGSNDEIEYCAYGAHWKPASKVGAVNASTPPDCEPASKHGCVGRDFQQRLEAAQRGEIMLAAEQAEHLRSHPAEIPDNSK